MVNWTQSIAEFGFTLFATFLGVLAAFMLDDRVRKGADRRQRAEALQRLKAMRRDLAVSVRDNLAIMARIKQDTSTPEGRWLPVVLLGFSTWEAHRALYVKEETNAIERKATTDFFEKLRTLQLLTGLGRMERERIVREITERGDPLRQRTALNPSATLVNIDRYLATVLDQAIAVGGALAPRLELEPSRWRRKKIGNLPTDKNA